VGGDPRWLTFCIRHVNHLYFGARRRFDRRDVGTREGRLRAIHGPSLGLIVVTVLLLLMVLLAVVHLVVLVLHGSILR
jgi:hypothetical protein